MKTIKLFVVLTAITLISIKPSSAQENPLDPDLNIESDLLNFDDDKVQMEMNDAGVRYPGDCAGLLAHARQESLALFRVNRQAAI